MSIYSLKDYHVTVWYEYAGANDYLDFSVTAYTPEEAEDKALERFTELDIDHDGTLSYDTTEI